MDPIPLADVLLIDVLLVEDSSSDAFLIEEALGESSRFRVTRIQRISEASALLAARKMSVVLLDLGLPDSQGVETLRELRRLDPDIPIIILTANNDEELAVITAQEGADEYLLKSELREGNLRLAIRYVIERRKSEKDLYLRDRAIQGVSQGIVITDATRSDNPIIYVSRGFEQITGYTSQEVIGKNCRFLQGGGTDPVAVSQLREAMLTKQTRAVEILNYRKDGTPFWNSVSISSIIDEGNVVKHFVGVQTDVTDRRNLEDQLHQSQKMEAVGQLAGGVAHDFNNQLTVIIGSCDILREFETLTDSGRAMIDDISQAGQRAASLTRQLLAFSRKQLLQPVVLNLNEIVANINKMLLRLIGEDIELCCRLYKSIWNVRLDPGQIEQVIINLVVNSRDAMPNGGRLTIETSNVEWTQEDCRLFPDRQPGHYVKIVIADSGSGISPDVKARMFEPFFTTKVAGKGTGLGLSVVHGIVKQSDGHIVVNSELGRGATMILYFPAVPDRMVTSLPDQGNPSIEHGTATILLVEDEDSVRRIVKVALETNGYTVLDASDGKKAVAIIEAHQGPVHLIVTDVVMPLINGRQLVEHVHQRFPKLKVLYVSGYTDDAVLRSGINYESHPYLQKPFSPWELIQKVRLVLDADHLF